MRAQDWLLPITWSLRKRLLTCTCRSGDQGKLSRGSDKRVLLAARLIPCTPGMISGKSPLEQMRTETTATLYSLNLNVVKIRAAPIELKLHRLPLEYL